MSARLPCQQDMGTISFGVMCTKQQYQQSLGAVFLFRTILSYTRENYCTVFLKANLKGISSCCGVSDMPGLWVMSVLGFKARMNHPLICCLFMVTTYMYDIRVLFI